VVGLRRGKSSSSDAVQIVVVVKNTGTARSGVRTLFLLLPRGARQLDRDGDAVGRVALGVIRIPALAAGAARVIRVDVRAGVAGLVRAAYARRGPVVARVAVPATSLPAARRP
jgi:hypothetical protein